MEGLAKSKNVTPDCRPVTQRPVKTGAYPLPDFHEICSSTQGCRGYGDSHGDSHRYGYGMGMGTIMNPHGPVGI